MSLSYKIKAAAVAAGFDLAGVAPVREFVELEAFPEWIADGHNGRACVIWKHEAKLAS